MPSFTAADRTHEEAGPMYAGHAASTAPRITGD